MADGDLVKKQVVAKIDGKTTVICLHAAGQIRPVDLPFETLNGPYMTPPFHVHCRSLVMPWMPGFVNDMRAQANFELLNFRSARIKKMADGRVPNRIPPPGDSVAMAPEAPGPKPAPKRKGKRAPAKRALPPKRTSPISDEDRPSSPITSVDEAAQYLAARGPMEDIHDSILQRSILRVPDRFVIEHLGGGVSDTYWVTDNATGEKWVLKKGDYAGEYERRANQHEDINEWAASYIARQWGLPAPEVRLAGFGWAMMRHADTSIPGASLDSSRIPRAPLSDRWFEEKDDTFALHVDVLRASIFDYLVDNGDRHGGNYLTLDVDGVPRLALIDHGLAFDGRGRRLGDAGGPDDDWADVSFIEYQERYANGGFVGLLAQIDYKTSPDRTPVADAVEEWLETVRESVEDGSLFEDMVESLAASGVPHDVIVEKIDWISALVTRRLELFSSILFRNGATQAEIDLEHLARGRL